MNKKKIIALILTGCAAIFTACELPAPTTNTTVNNAPPANANLTANTNTNSNTTATNVAPVAEDAKLEIDMPVTLPVLDAMFADETFAADLKSKLGLTDEQIEKLKTASRDAVGNLDQSEETGSTKAATDLAGKEISGIIGADKTKELANLIRSRWTEGEMKTVENAKPNTVPTDTRIVVNAPAYRMDLFKDGQLVRSYKIGIGYPEFPLPTGMRKATTIIFNPTWTPPDEPWVRKSKTVKAGKTVEAGSKLNPLGPIKIPIGSPSLIHGGKSAGKLGGFASHGCVGLTNPQVQDFASALAQLTQTSITEENINNYEKAKTETKNVKLAQTVPVELRYETIVAEDGKLFIYRDVYERGLNNEEHLKEVLQGYGVSYDSLSDKEKTQVREALKQMSLDAAGKVSDGKVEDGKKDKEQRKPVTKSIKGKKEIMIPIEALKGKGYPSPVDLNSGVRSKKPLKIGNKANTNSNANSANTQSNAAQSKKF